MALRSAESGEREARAIETEPDDSDEQQSLIPQQGEGSGGSEAKQPDAGGAGGSEVRALLALAWPIMGAQILRSLTQQTTVIVVGHLGARELGACALATMFINITGLSIITGGMSALDTVAAQAFGAKSYALVGQWTQRCVLITTLFCLPIAALWTWGLGPVLTAIGIDEPTAALSVRFTRISLLWMWPTFINRAVETWLRSQGIVKPVVRTLPLVVQEFFCTHPPNAGSLFLPPSDVAERPGGSAPRPDHATLR